MTKAFSYDKIMKGCCITLSLDKNIILFKVVSFLKSTNIISQKNYLSILFTTFLQKIKRVKNPFFVLEKVYCHLHFTNKPLFIKPPILN